MHTFSKEEKQAFASDLLAYKSSRLRVLWDEAKAALEGTANLEHEEGMHYLFENVMHAEELAEDLLECPHESDG